MVSSVLSAGLTTVYQHLTAFAGLESFWTNFDSIFGTEYNLAVAQLLRSQWQSQDFSLFPQIEVVSSEVLGSAKGAYAISTNKIYLSDQFVSVASQQSLEAVILEEFGHFVDAQVNATDTTGDEGELFSAIVRGVSLSAAELGRIKAEDDHAVIVVNGQSIAVEQAVTLVGVWDRLNYAWAVTVVGNYAYAVGDMLEIIDISNPSNPIFKGNYDVSDYAFDVQVVGNYAYVVDGSGLQIIDISNPTAPTLKGNYNTSVSAFGVQVVGNYAYVAYGSSGLQIIDISNPTAPTLKGNYDTSGYYALGVQVVGNYAYVADEDSGLQIIDISNPTAPTLKGNYNTSGKAYRVQVVGNYAYVADYWSGLQIIDISNPTAPTLKGNYDTSGNAVGVQVVGNYVYIADTGSGLQIIDISKPTAPTLKGNYDTSGSAYGVQVVGNYAYIADDHSGLQIIGISNPIAPTLKGNYDASGNAYRVQVVGNYAYVANQDLGLQIIDISNPTAPTVISNYYTSGGAWGVQVVGNYAYVTDQAPGQVITGLQIIDISNPTAPTVKGNYYTSGGAQGVQVVGNYAYVADGGSGLQIIDISNPTAPTLKGNYDTSGNAYGVQVVGNYAYVADFYSGLQIIDISNPIAPTLKGNYDTSGGAFGVQVVGNYAYVADYYSGLQIIEISNPIAPTLKGNYDTSGSARSVQVVGNYAYVADDDSGLQIIDISNPIAPTLKGNYDTSGSAYGVQVVGNYAYVADWTGGLKIIDVSDLTSANQSPTNLALSNSTIAENQAIGTAIGTFTSTDPDTGNTFTYSLVTGTGSTDNALFAITGNQLQSNGIFDFETKNSYSIRVRTTDQGGLTFEKQLTIGVTNIIDDSTSVTLAAVDTGWYDSSGSHDPRNTNYFVGDYNDGVLRRDWMSFNLPTFTQPVVAAQLKIKTYEYSSADASETYELRDVTTPVLTLVAGGSGLTNIYNDLGTGVIYGSRVFTSADSNQTVTINLTPDAVSALNAKSGQAFALGGWLTTLDTISNKECVFAFSSASDPTSNVQLVLSTALDLPVITLAVSPASVLEDGTPNLVYTFTRTGDLTNALTVNYSIAGTADATDYTGATPGTGKTITFAAGSATATLTIDPTADALVEPDETVILTLASGTDYTIGTTNSTTGTILNDDTTNQAPTNLSLSNSNIAENQVIRTVIGNLTTTDPDTGSTFTYSLVTGTGSTDNALFTISGNQLQSNGIFDYETKNSYSIRVRTTDQGGLTFEKQLIIGITDVIETPANLILTPQQDIFINEGLDDTVTGTFANLQQNDNINGGAGIDTLILSGGTSTDSLEIDASNSSNQLNIAGTTTANFERFDLSGFLGTVSFSGYAGNNWIKSGAGNDELTGDSGNDYLNGGTGTDQLLGWKGNDTYVVDNTGDVIIEALNAGIDSVESSVTWTLKTNIENLSLTGTAAINGTGNTLANLIVGNNANNSLNGDAGNDTLTANDGNDTLNGGAGADSLIGGTGNDVYYIDNAGDTITELSGEGTETVYSTVNYTLAANLENLILQGTAINGTGNELNNSITGNASNNILIGGDGNDVLNGSTGADSLIGGTGNDVYYIDNAGDTITELSGEGTDTVYSTVDYTFVGTNLENLTLQGTAINGTGNEFNNSITGNASNNILNGGDGNDTLSGGDGNDTLSGGTGNDTLNGGAGADSLTGGIGNDVYYIDNAGDTITELSGEGTETVYSTVDYTFVGTNLENLVLQGTAINGTGNELNNSITGNASNNILSGGDGNDTLNGSTGVDSLIGGTGNDSYYIDNAGDTITELSGEGTDIVYSTLDYTLVGTYLENLTLQGTAINGTGNEFNNSITGNASNNILSGGAGNDTLNGGTGIDTLTGGLGNDTYTVDNVDDIVTETSTLVTEIDTVNSSVTYTLSANVEKLTLTGTVNIDGTGNTLANTLTGNSGNNILTGNGGNDVLTGNSGSDILVGGTGNDSLYLGSDTVTDTVNYASGDGVDTVYNFVRGVGGDVLKFTSITAIDVQISGTSTLFKVGDGISGNTGFGTGTLLLTTSATSGFGAADVNVNLLGATFAFS
jgi:Ca2+-binding RTX toxin-like protein